MIEKNILFKYVLTNGRAYNAKFKKNDVSVTEMYF